MGLSLLFAAAYLYSPVICPYSSRTGTGNCGVYKLCQAWNSTCLKISFRATIPQITIRDDRERGATRDILRDILTRLAGPRVDHPESPLAPVPRFRSPSSSFLARRTRLHASRRTIQFFTPARWFARSSLGKKPIRGEFFLSRKKIDRHLNYCRDSS